MYILGAILLLIASPLQADQTAPILAKGQLLPVGNLNVRAAKAAQGIEGLSRIIFTENFDASGAASAWNTGGQWEIGRPTAGPSNCPSAPNCAGVNLSGNYSDDRNDRLISPPISLPALSAPAEKLQLKFKEWLETESGYDYGRVEISTDRGSSWTQLDRRSGSSEWQESVLDISSYQGEEVLLAFRFTSDGSVRYKGWYVDDVQVISERPKFFDVDIVSINHQNFPFLYLNINVDTLGVALTELDESNFQIYEDNILQVDYFEVSPPEAGSGVRLADIVFVLDITGSMEDELNGVKRNMLSFVQALRESDVNFRIGIVEYADEVYVFNGGNLYADPDVIQATVDGISLGEHGLGSGDEWPEDGFDALKAATLLNFRPGSQRIFILLTDAPSHFDGDESVYSNYSDGDVTDFTRDEIIAELQRDNVVVYAVAADIGTVDGYSRYNYQYRGPGSITEATNGRWFSISSNFNDIILDIQQSISSQYVVQYRSSNPDLDGSTRVVGVSASYIGESDIAYATYVAGSPPSIERTPSTLALHEQSWAEGTELRIEVEVKDDVPPAAERATLYARHVEAPDFQVLDMTNVRDDLWQAVIPGSVSREPGIEYYITASDGDNTVSDPSVDAFNAPYQLAILPNESPRIAHGPVTVLEPGSPVEIRARVTDSTNRLESVRLFYRKTGQLSYEEISTEASGSDYSIQIPRDFVTVDGVDYYIKAWDDFGISSTSGTADRPHQIESGEHDPERAALVALYNATDGENWNNKTNWLGDKPLSEWHGVTTDEAGKVTSLVLDANNLTGPLSPQLGNLSNLEELSLSDNKLMGPIPYQLGNLSNLNNLMLSGEESEVCLPSNLDSWYYRIGSTDWVISCPDSEHVLKREVEGKVEVFDIKKHIWRFNNSRSNIWPESWWKQFDYGWWSLPWANSNDFPSWPRFAEAFGNTQVYWNPPPPLIVFKAKARWKWFFIKGSFSFFSDWGGSCFGFSLSSLLFFDQVLAVEEIFGDGKKLYDVEINDDSGKARILINKYFVYQYGKESKNYEDLVWDYTPRETLEVIKTSLKRKDNHIGLAMFNWTQGILKEKIDGGHSVVPYKVVADPGNENKVWIFVYDNNRPDDKDRKVIIDTSTNTWEYTPLGWGSSKGLLPELPVRDYNIPATLKRTGQRSLATTENDFIEVYSETTHAITLRNPEDSSWGFADGGLIQNAEVGHPIVTLNPFNPPERPLGYYIPAQNYEIETKNFSESESRIFINGAVGFVYQRADADSTQIDQFQYGGNSLAVINAKGPEKQFSLEMFLEDTQQAKLYQVQTSLPSDESIDFAVRDGDHLRIENTGTNKKYDVLLRFSSADSDIIFQHENIELPANAVHQVAPEWSKLGDGRIAILQDQGMDGVFEDTLSVNNLRIDDTPPTGNGLDDSQIYFYPNPFNPDREVGILRYSLRQSSEVTTKIYDIAGHVVMTLTDKEFQEAETEQGVTWDGKNEAGDLIANGTYLFVIETEAGERAIGKIAVLR